MKKRAKIARALRLDKVARWLGLFGTLDTDKVIRALKLENLALKKQNAQLQERPHIWIDPRVRQRQQGYEQSEWNSEPERNTEKPQVIPNSRGRYFQERRKEFEYTHELPKAPKPTRSLSFTRLVLDDSWLR